MPDKHNKNSRKKVNSAGKINVYKKRFAALDKKTQTQMIVFVFACIFAVIFGAVARIKLSGNDNSQPSSQSDISSMIQNSEVKPKYEDEYLKFIKDFDDIVIPLSEKNEKNYLKETIFVGDSNTEALSMYGHISLQNTMGVTGMPINTVTSLPCMWFVGRSEPVTIPTAISMMKPRRIIINYGTNNAGGTETDDFIKMYKKTIKAIEKAYPYTDIIVASIFPVAEKSKYPYITMEDIDSFNMALAEMCREEGYKFLNTAEEFKNPEDGFIKDKYISSDGIHLNGDGYRAYLEYVKTHQHIVKDERPARGNIPTRANPPEPTASPSPSPSVSPTPSISPTPSVSPSPSPSATPTPSPEVTLKPTQAPEVTKEPVTATATPEITAEPTVAPAATSEPTAEPTAAPTAVPTAEPTQAPPADPTPTPTPTPDPRV